MRRLGWTQAEIGEAVGLKQPAIAKQLFQIPDSVKGIKTQLAKSGQINAIAEAYNMPLVLATALDLGAASTVSEIGSAKLGGPFCPRFELVYSHG